MSKKSEIFLSDGQSYQLNLSPEQAAEKLMEDGKIKQGLQSFHTTGDKEIFVNPAHVVLVTDYHSPDDPPETSSNQEQEMGDEERKSHNLKEAQKFQEDIGNME